MENNNQLFKLLQSKVILEILDGDRKFGEIAPVDGGANIVISMPYMSGPTLCEISNKFGLPVTYNWGGAKSRWEYLNDLLQHCITKNRTSELLAFLFSKSQFIEKLSGHSAATIDRAYKQIVSTIIEQINGALYFGGNELVVVGNRFLIRAINSKITIKTPTVEKIDREYIRNLSERAIKDISDNNFDSAITKARTLLEEVFCFVIEKKNIVPSDSGDIRRLYNQVKELYNMHQDKNIDKRINMLLSGLEKILSSIAEMRNENSDSHGVGARRINILNYHARLYVNAAMTMADFILAVGEYNN